MIILKVHFAQEGEAPGQDLASIASFSQVAQTSGPRGNPSRREAWNNRGSQMASPGQMNEVHGS